MVKPKRFWEERYQDAVEHSAVKMICALCGAAKSGRLDKMREWLRDHQAKKHPEFVPRKLTAPERAKLAKKRARR